MSNQVEKQLEIRSHFHRLVEEYGGYNAIEGDAVECFSWFTEGVSFALDNLGKGVSALQAEQEPVAAENLKSIPVPPKNFKLLAYNRNDGEWAYINHADAWQGCPPPTAQAAVPESLKESILCAAEYLYSYSELLSSGIDTAGHYKPEDMKQAADGLVFAVSSTEKQTRTQLPDGVTTVRNASTGEAVRTRILNKDAIHQAAFELGGDPQGTGYMMMTEEFDELLNRIERGDFDSGEAVKTGHEDWDYCAAVCAHPAVDASLSKFARYPDGETEVRLVREILAATEVLAAMGVVPGQGEDK